MNTQNLLASQRGRLLNNSMYFRSQFNKKTPNGDLIVVGKAVLDKKPYTVSGILSEDGIMSLSLENKSKTGDKTKINGRNIYDFNITKTYNLEVVKVDGAYVLSCIKGGSTTFAKDGTSTHSTLPAIAMTFDGAVKEPYGYSWSFSL